MADPSRAPALESSINASSGGLATPGNITDEAQPLQTPTATPSSSASPSVTVDAAPAGTAALSRTSEPYGLPSIGQSTARTQGVAVRSTEGPDAGARITPGQLITLYRSPGEIHTVTLQGSRDSPGRGVSAAIDFSMNQSLISQELVRLLGASERPLPPGQYQQQFMTQVGIIAPTHFTTLWLSGIPYGIPDIEINIASSPIPNLNPRFQLYLGRGVFDKLASSGYRIRFFDPGVDTLQAVSVLREDEGEHEHEGAGQDFDEHIGERQDTCDESTTVDGGAAVQEIWSTIAEPSAGMASPSILPPGKGPLE